MQFAKWTNPLITTGVQDFKFNRLSLHICPFSQTCQDSWTNNTKKNKRRKKKVQLKQEIKATATAGSRSNSKKQ